MNRLVSIHPVMATKPIAEIVEFGTGFGIILYAPMPGVKGTVHGNYPQMVRLTPDVYQFLQTCVKLGIKKGHMCITGLGVDITIWVRSEIFETPPRKI